MNIGKRVQVARKRAQLSQDALARRASMSVSAVAQIEQGGRTDPHYSTLKKIAEALNISISELIGESVPLVETSPSGSPSPEDEGEVVQLIREELARLDQVSERLEDAALAPIFNIEKPQEIDQAGEEALEEIDRGVEEVVSDLMGALKYLSKRGVNISEAPIADQVAAAMKRLAVAQLAAANRPPALTVDPAGTGVEVRMVRREKGIRELIGQGAR